MNRRRLPSEHELQTQLEEAEAQAEILRDIKKNAPGWERLDRELALDSRYQAAPSAHRRHSVRRIAVLVAALLALSSIPAVAMNWEKITAFFTQSWKTHTTVGNSPLESKEGCSVRLDDLYVPACLPEGYFPAKREEHKGFTEICYQDKEGNNLLFLQGKVDFRMELNTENSEAKTIQIDEEDGLFMVMDETYVLVWGVKPQLLLAGKLPYEEMLRIAESVSLSDFQAEIKEKEGMSK